MPSARFAIPKFLLAPRAWMASSRSISNVTVANDEKSTLNERGSKDARKGIVGARVRDAADEPRLSPRTVPVRQSRIPNHHLPHRSGEAARGGARAARTRRARGAGQI